ncbi:MAG: STAS/SEC14 domain-containing protein [Methylovirgula sp.]
MIEIIKGFPDSVVGFIARGHVTSQDYTDVLIPAVETALHRHGRIRCYYELGPDFTGFDAGALWEDARIGFEHLSQWERVAVVTDTDWIRLSVKAFRFLLPDMVRIFSTSQAAEARAWIATA